MRGVDHAAADDGERGEQAGGAVPGVVMAAPPGHPGQHRLGPVSAWVPDFSSMHSTTVLPGGSWQSPATTRDLAHQHRVRGQLEAVAQVRLERPDFRQIRPIVDGESPLRAAIEARDQCVASFGVSSKVAVMTCSTLSSASPATETGAAPSTRPGSSTRSPGSCRPTRPAPLRRSLSAPIVSCHYRCPQREPPTRTPQVRGGACSLVSRKTRPAKILAGVCLLRDGPGRSKPRIMRHPTGEGSPGCDLRRYVAGNLRRYLPGRLMRGWIRRR